MDGLAYLAIGLVVTLVTTWVVHTRARRLRGGWVAGVVMVVLWPFVLMVWLLAGLAGGVIAWHENFSR